LKKNTDIRRGKTVPDKKKTGEQHKLKGEGKGSHAVREKTLYEYLATAGDVVEESSSREVSSGKRSNAEET